MSELLQAIRETVRYHEPPLTASQIVAVLVAVIADHGDNAYHEQSRQQK